MDSVPDAVNTWATYGVDPQVQYEIVPPVATAAGLA
jgi:hypothetical protein